MFTGVGVGVLISFILVYVGVPIWTVIALAAGLIIIGYATGE